jgi:hypothetical protein
MSIPITGTTIITVVNDNFLVLSVDGTVQHPPFNATFCHIAELNADYVVIEDGAKGIDKAWRIPLDSYFESDGSTALDNEAKVTAYLKDKIGS